MKMNGFERADFTIKESGERITGYNVYLTRQIANDRGRGHATERVYLTDRKIEENEIKLEDLLGKEVIVSYNRYGKPQTITLA